MISASIHAGPRSGAKRLLGLFAAMAAIALAAGSPAIAQDKSAIDAITSFDAQATPLAGSPRIAYLTECVQNPYCQARLHGVEDAAKKYGIEFKVFDANFNPAEQLKQVQNAAAENFDGYIMGPTAAGPACSMWKQYLAPTGKPVVTVDLPMCDDVDYTKGLAATVTMQRQGFFDLHVENAFASCDGPCEVAAVGGYLGSDLFNLWENAIDKAAKKHPNVSVVVNQPGNFDPRTALRVIQDGLRAHPDIKVVISSWDDMTRGVEQAITSVGKTPGQDVRIYTVGGTKDAAQKIKDGIYNGTSILSPYEESYYGVVAMAMALQGKPLNAYVDEALLPSVVNGPGTVLIDKSNVDSFKPAY